MSDELSLVPPERLGALLTQQRTVQGITIDELQETADVGFTSDELRRIEQGHLPLSDDQINRLMIAYGATSGVVVPERSELIVDLHHGALLAGSKTRVLPTEATLDDILGRYLSLLYLMRDLQPGHRLSLRGHDLDILAGALERSVADVEGRLFEMMLPGQVSPWFQRLRHRIAVPAAGLLVGLTSVGSLVLVQFPKGDRPSIPRTIDGTDAVADDDPALTQVAGTQVVNPSVQIASAVAVTRGPGDAELAYEPGNPASVGAAAEELVAYPFRDLLADWTISYAGPREGFFGNTNTVTRTITVYVSSLDTPEGVAGVLAHEVGHAIDVMYLDDDARARWLDARDADVAWWPESGGGDFGLGAGDFAEAVAVVIAGSPSDSQLGSFSDSQLALVHELIPPDAGSL